MKENHDITFSQIKKMAHALGFTYNTQSFRNYYFLYQEDTEWEDLVKRGLALKRVEEPGHMQKDGGVYYFVSPKGKEMMTYIYPNKCSNCGKDIDHFKEDNSEREEQPETPSEESFESSVQ